MCIFMRVKELVTNSNEANLLSPCDILCSKKQISATQKTQSFILSSDRAFDVSLTKAPAPKAPFTGFFLFLMPLLFF